MRIAVFTGNQPRHLALIESLSMIASEVFAVQECATVFPGKIQDFYSKSEVMAHYFDNVSRAEHQIFGAPRFLPPNVMQLVLKYGDLSLLDLAALRPALEADILIVFGSSYIKGPLADLLISRRALNLHMGVSPYYRGSSCNFWAMRDGNLGLVGATIHLLSKGLDSGAMLFHAVPLPEEVDPFVIGMKAVKAAHTGIIQKIVGGQLLSLTPVPQDRGLEIRYSRHADFTDAVAAEYLGRLPTPVQIAESMANRKLDRLLRPFVG